MPNQRGKSSAGRRSTAAAAGAASKPKAKLEPLPEIPDAHNSNAETPTTSSPAGSHSSSRKAKSEANTSYRDDGAMQAGSSLTDASNRTHTAQSDRRRPSAVVEADSVSSTPLQTQAQRPRSRTASPWRGKARPSGNIFSRPKASANRQSAMGAQLALQSDVGSPHDPNSAIVGASDTSMVNSGISSAGLVLERSSTIAGDRPDQHPAHRRRGLTMDPDHYGGRQISTSTGTESGEMLESPAAQQSVPGSHFHISRNNTALAARTDKRMAQVGNLAKISKTTSGSSNSTVTTVEIDVSASSTHSYELSEAVPRGQLAKMLYNDPREPGVGGADLPPLDTPALNTSVRGSTGASGLSSAGILGRTKRGGSGGDSRLGDYKGALMRPPTMDIFGTRSRNNVGDLQASSGGAYDDPDLRGGVAHSGPVESSGAFMSSSAEKTMPHARHAQPMRGGLSSGDDIMEDTRSTVTFSHAPSSKDAISGGGQQPRAVPLQGLASKGDWTYTSPGERSGTHGTTDELGHRVPHRPAASRTVRGSAISPQYEYSEANDTPMAISSDSKASTALHQRRESGQVGRAQVGPVHQHGRIDGMPRISSDISTHPPLARSSEAYGGSGSRLPSGTDPAMFDGGDGEKWQSKLAANGSFGNNSNRGNHAVPSKPRNPWSLAPSRGCKEILRYHYPEAWTSLAIAPYNEPMCAAAGTEGLYLLSMGPDKIMLRSAISNGRRRSSPPHFNDVVWRPLDYIVTGSNIGKVMVWDPNRRGDQTVHAYGGDIGRTVQRLAVKPSDSNFVYAAYSEGHICGWDFRSDSSTPSLRITASMVPQDIDCNPIDTNMIAAVTQEGRLSVWDIRKPTQPLIGVPAHGGKPALCISWHPTGRFIGTGGNDSTIRIWDFKTASYKKNTATPFCIIKTISTARRLKWRPGHDTQISSSANGSDPRFQVWDMRNPNHSMCFHQKHDDRVMGFAWYDENTVWTAGREKVIFQCDIRRDAMYTAGLLGYSAVDISPSTHLTVATGVYKPDISSSSTPAIPRPIADSASTQPAKKPPTSSGSSRSKAKRLASGSGDGDSSVVGPTAAEEEEYQDLVYLSRFQPNLPVPYVDEHPLGPELGVESNAIRSLARSYRYDPNKIKECCEHNSKEARAIGLAEIAKFWQFLSVVFGDALPLKSKRRQAKAAAEATAASFISPSTIPETRLVEPADTGAQRPFSVATSRSSSGMLASRPVSATYNIDDASNDAEMLGYPGLNVRSMTAQNTPLGSLGQLQITPLLTGSKSAGDESADSQFQPRSATLGINGDSGRLQRSHLSRSHSNLQHAMAPSKFGSVPSPKLRSTAHSMSIPPSNFASEPTTPAYRAGGARLPRNNTTGANLSLVGSERIAEAEQEPGSSDVAETNGREALLTELSKRFFLQTSVTPSTDQLASVVSFPSPPMPLAPPQNILSVLTNPSFANGLPEVSKGPPPPLVNVAPPRHVTKAELRMAVSSCEYYVDLGDVQTAVTAALLLRNFIRLDEWQAVEEWFHAYIMQLDLFKEYAAATEILLASPFASVQDPITLQTTMCVNCSICDSQLAMLPHSGLSWCAVCRSMANSCVVCELPVRGEFIWCHVCGHGGHAEHIRSWFVELNQRSCPSGCGHECQPLIVSYAPKPED
ncbi:SEA (Seh1-associated) complex subunit [Coemansia sp. RSA 2050]|nr:SEA (Seh1-associated) complex subunit [Coemansia sp. RSA 2050]KAJ2729889.1 SEA (Seh1-associated) complex subunit [Coemansia sp. BCRC 34962]